MGRKNRLTAAESATATVDAPVTPEANGTNGHVESPATLPLPTAVPAAPAPSSRKTVCELSRAEFHAAAKPLVLTGEGLTLILDPKEFSTGSIGFGFQGPVYMEIAGHRVKLQAGVNLTVANSKELPRQ